jgi:hypothetical protein
MKNLFLRNIEHLLTSLFFIAILLACKSSSTLSSSSQNNDNVEKSKDNNVIAVGSTNTISNPNSKDEIIFEGKNNLFELIQENSSYFDETHDVIIIKGDNTIIKLLNINIVDLRSVSTDTLVIFGNNQKYVMDVRNSIATNKDIVDTDVIHLKESTFDASPYSQDSIQNDRPVKFWYFDSLVSVKYAYNYFVNGLKTEEPKYYYELAEMYLYGLGVDESTAKAIELHEYAAAKDYIPSLVKLGDIFTGRFSVKPDKNKSLYFYKRCQSLGESYCDEQIKKMK